MRYDSDLLYRPPGEWRSYLLQCTVGCSYNGCTYCGMYKNKQYHVRPLADILEDIDMAREHFTDFGSFPLGMPSVTRSPCLTCSTRPLWASGRTVCPDIRWCRCTSPGRT